MSGKICLKDRRSIGKDFLSLTCAAPEILVRHALRVPQVGAVRLHEAPPADDRCLDDGVETRIQRLRPGYALHL